MDRSDEVKLSFFFDLFLYRLIEPRFSPFQTYNPLFPTHEPTIYRTIYRAKAAMTPAAAAMRSTLKAEAAPVEAAGFVVEAELAAMEEEAALLALEVALAMEEEAEEAPAAAVEEEWLALELAEDALADEEAATVLEAEDAAALAELVTAAPLELAAAGELAAASAAEHCESVIPWMAAEECVSDLFATGHEFKKTYTEGRWRSKSPSTSKE